MTSPEKLTAIHLAVEDELISMRDSRIQLLSNGRFSANGLVVCEMDGSPSDVIRLGTRDAIKLILAESAKYDLAHPDEET
jgi:hypothetical protein